MSSVLKASLSQSVFLCESRGTLNTVVLALRGGLPVEIYDCEGKAVAIDHALRIAEDRGVLAAIEAAEAQTE